MKYYLAKNRRGKLCRIVEDVQVPMQIEKLHAMGHDVDTTRQAIIARFTNEQLAREFLNAWYVVHNENKGEKQ